MENNTKGFTMKNILTQLWEGIQLPTDTSNLRHGKRYGMTKENTMERWLFCSYYLNYDLSSSCPVIKVNEYNLLPRSEVQFAV